MTSVLHGRESVFLIALKVLQFTILRKSFWVLFREDSGWK